MFGILNLNKPAGWTSRGVVNRVARLVRPARAGHAGTLDPLATGVLIVCIGPATRLVPYIHEHPKTYEGTFLLGKSSPTDDVEGELTDVPIPSGISRLRLEQLLPEFTGEIEQIPPAYSAVKIKGERAYRAARRGEQVDVPPRTVVVHRIELLDFDEIQGSFSLRIECGTGTYIRSIGRDLARRLGTEGVMSSLTRTAIGPCLLSDAVDVETLDAGRLAAALAPPLSVLPHLPTHRVLSDDLQRLMRGQPCDAPADVLQRATPDRPLAVVDAANRLVALAVEKRGRLAPHMVLMLPAAEDDPSATHDFRMGERLIPGRAR